jgi:hypothetical protein
MGRSLRERNREFESEPTIANCWVRDIRNGPPVIGCNLEMLVDHNLFATELTGTIQQQPEAQSLKSKKFKT